ncbi:1-phosphatidylinositol 3-phosphate 5-kinase FAB1 [Hypsizygus marmoreus]|uniref:1-phosphatidylinositol-3-phosphate 5-kinase n=1 Tax=Hypsizygus marmoreus TaxID=39966 RepID=A0A369K804_HYPMA|nr:1-phosphatidylinositol 3-phosphate 5-kinase FAB1 [Hypsizygus marmoreus]
MTTIGPPTVASPVTGTFSGQSSRSSSNTKLADDVTSLTSFNPFSEEDENDQSSYTLVTSIFSRMKNTLSAPLSSAVAAASNTNQPAPPNPTTQQGASEQRRPSYTAQTQSSSFSSRASGTDRPFSLATAPAQVAPPLVSLTPAQSEVPTYSVDYDRSPSRSGTFYSPVFESSEGIPFGTSIPGFPIQDDARSVKTTASLHRSGSVSKVIRRIRGEGLSRDYWMDDENCKECYDCKSVFTTWRRKHHCRICGQIFCSRCASNIIKGSRFGHDGMVRVCNLCLEKLAKVDEDDDDDRRSVVSSVTSFPAHQLGLDMSGSHPQSPFAASQLFGRTDEPFNLYSIAETKRLASGSEESFGSRPVTPHLMEREDGIWEPIQGNPAPFRRALSDEEKDPSSLANGFHSADSPTAPGSKTPVEFPVTMPINTEGPMSSIQFPIGSPDGGLDSPRPRSRLRSRFNSYGDFDPATPFIRSRVHSRLESMSNMEPAWRTRRESTAYAQELNLTSMMHLKVMLRQMLRIEQIPNVKEWEEVLSKLALRIARELTFTALPHRQGEDMDVRKYVKIKKIPGGTPQDSEYVDGAVITKNVAHKQMSRFQRNPRVMLVTFPLEFYRVEGQYMHFGQIVRQEKEYLGNLASRIAALRPHVVLVEQSVSRLALDALAKHNIAVARTVKPSAIQTIARMTQGDVFSSMDKLALEPRLGHCSRFRIQTYDHPLIPGRRKTYMRFEGCSRDMGCTIILRGGDIDTLRRIKKVTRFLTFIVRNLKLETHLWKDSVITLPPFNPDAIPASMSGRLNLPNFPLSTSFVMPSFLSSSRLATPTVDLHESPAHATIKEVDTDDEDLQNEESDQVKLSRRIDQSLEAYAKTFISVSATLRFPPPYPLRRMKELDNELIKAKQAWEDEIIRREEQAHSHSLRVQESTITAVTPTEASHETDQSDINAQIEALPSVVTPSTPPTGESLFGSPVEHEVTSYFLHPGTAALPSVSPDFTAGPMAPEVRREPLKTPADIALESTYSLLKWKHEEQRRIWEWYLRKNPDDFVVEKYQCISLWEYTIPTAEFGQHNACFAPRLNYITFYGENDCTLGQYIERSVGETLVQFLDPKAICTGKGCDKPLARHCKVYVHNETRLFVAVEQWDGQIIGRNPAPDLITTWSACRVCGSATPFIPVSEEMQRYSFAKFLELHFYPADVKLVQGAGCQHNIYKDHIRYFASKGMTVRFQTDPVTMHEIVYPPFRIRVRPETQLELKNADFERLHHRNFMWYSGLIDDLKLISIDAATGDEETDARLLLDINSLIARAESEREDISRLINRIYRESAPTDTLALNQVHSYRQDKIVAWQHDFDRLPKPRPIQTLDRSSKRASAFGSVRAMWPRRYDLAGAFDHPHLPSSSVSEAEEGPLNMRRVTGDSFTSSASEASEPETNIEEDSKRDSSHARAGLAQNESPKDVSPEEPSGQDLGAPSFAVNMDHPKSDPESDSTIGAVRDDAAPTSEVTDERKAEVDEEVVPVQRLSRLPRRVVQNPSVAELVRKYQDFLPPQGVHDLTRTALAPPAPISESEQEYSSPIPRRPLVRNKSRHRMPSKKPSTSDFEQGYAANIAPRYLTQSRRALTAQAGNRIPGPAGLQSQESSRRPSPEKRSFSSRGKEVKYSRPSSPTNVRHVSSTGKPIKQRVSSRPKEKIPARAPPIPGTKSTFRRQPTGTGSKVSNIAKHFERLGRDAERSKSRYSVIRGRRARPVASARAKVEVLDSVKDAIKDESESSDSSSEADDEDEGAEEERTVPELLQSCSPESDLTSPDAAAIKTAPPLISFPDTTGETEIPTLEVPSEPISLPPSPFLTSEPMGKDTSFTPPTSDAELPGGPERGSILKALSGFWLQQPPISRHALDDDPMSDPEHIFRDSSMVVRTDEPTSIIALALNSPQYREMLARSRAEKRTAREAKLNDSGEAFMPDDKSVAESSSTWGVVNVDSAELADPTEDLKVPSSKLPWAITFESGGLTISCTVLYPEQFDALRRTYDCEKSMIESLSRCVKWNAGGGKSGSAFLKTRDDRFIAKELSRPELQTMETFAPAYFDYMSSAVSANRPTLLAKHFGCFKLTFKKTGKDRGPGKSKSTQMNLLVMENLFYDRRFTKIYDLKGSTRNRHVQSTGRENEVLLDENLVETAHLYPFYLREHSKRILRGALYNDSKFLADINVMDYSLVCGVDSQNNELVVGIVDYIRTYTWDKKLESWVKESAFLGGRGEPTIVTPKQYRQRFISAMERYFPLIPDRWMKQKDTPEEDSNSLLELWPDW